MFNGCHVLGPSMTALAHNHDERVSVANLEFGTRVLSDVVSRFCGRGNHGPEAGRRTLSDRIKSGFLWIAGPAILSGAASP